MIENEALAVFRILRKERLFIDNAFEKQAFLENQK